MTGGPLASSPSHSVSQRKKGGAERARQRHRAVAAPAIGAAGWCRRGVAGGHGGHKRRGDAGEERARRRRQGGGGGPRGEEEGSGAVVAAPLEVQPSGGGYEAAAATGLTRPARRSPRRRR